MQKPSENSNKMGDTAVLFKNIGELKRQCSSSLIRFTHVYDMYTNFQDLGIYSII